MADTAPGAVAAALHVEGLHKSFGPKPVLAGLDLDVAPGHVTAVLGPSGCGKTTLLRIVAGFERPDAGTVELGGRTVAAPKLFVPPERRRVGVVPQEGALFPHLDVGANVGFGLPRGAAASRRVAEVLELVGLPGYERRRPHQLSGGQQHRVALARALAPGPSLVVLDEPFSSLDTGLRGQVRTEVLKALRATGTTSVLVTHDQQEALSVADEVAVLLHGRIAQTADPGTLYERPADLEVARFVGDTVVLTGWAGPGWVDCALGRLRVHPGAPDTGEVTVVLRPEHLDLVAVDGEPFSSPAPVPGTVTGRSYFGHDAMVGVRLETGPEVRLRLQATAVPEVGAAVAVVVRAPALAFASRVPERP